MKSSPNDLQLDEFFEIDEKSDAVAHFVTLVGSQLQSAFLERKTKEGLTQQALAKALEVDRSRINRCLSGYSNLTLESVAELVWALRGSPVFSIDLQDDADPHCNHHTDQHSLIAPRSSISKSTPPSFGTPTSTTSRTNTWTQAKHVEPAE